jgi:ribonuclease-3
MEQFKKFEEAIGVEFHDKNLLKTAFTHRSYLNENASAGMEHNERLEFLGDAVLELVVTSYLYKTFPDKPEGDLTAYRSSLVNTNSISDAAQSLGMNEYLLLSKGEAKDTGKARQYILANTYESVIGAIYLDQGYDVASRFISMTLFEKLQEIIDKKLYKDAKSYVQELAQEHENVTPTYQVMYENGPDHDKNFEVGVYFGEQLIAKGKGKSKQEAEQSAARAGLAAKNWV